MRLRYEADARADLLNILDYGIDNNLSHPVAYMLGLRERLAHLADIEHPGRKGRVANTREWVVSGTPYIAVYQIAGDTLTILRVLHGAQRWP
jgi:addiction module RelE/StbE family toxin